MNPVTYIRTKVFDCKTQADFGVLLGTSQATVSRWEDAGRIPGPKQPLIREKALKRGAWDDRWFFVAPDHGDPSDKGAAA